MKLDEIIKAKIAEMGHVHEVTADRSMIPVLYTPAAEEGADVWELWLKGTRHPDWQIIHRRLTAEEAVAIQRDVPRGLNPYPDQMPCDFYVKNGRKPEWTRSLVTRPDGPKRILHAEDVHAMPRRQLDPRNTFTFKGELESSEDAPECPYNQHVGGTPLSEGEPFTGDPRTHADCLKRLEINFGDFSD